MTDSHLEYNKKIEKYISLQKRLKSQLNLISNLRLLTAVIGFGGAAFLLFKNEGFLSAAIFIISLVLFILLVIRHDRLKLEKKRIDLLWKINQDAIKRTNGEWSTFEETGEDFIDYEHKFSGDLDLFGQGSLFQWINTGVTYIGRIILKQWFTDRPKNREDILKRQRAAKELSDMLDWRQEFQVEAMLAEDKLHNPELLYKWTQHGNEFYRKKAVIYMAQLLPFLTVLLLIGSFLIPFIPFYIPALLIVVQMIMIGLRFIDMGQILSDISPYVNNIKIYRKMLEIFETQEFQTDYLKELQAKLCSTKGRAAYLQVLELEKITDHTSIRHSQLYLVINILLLWDYQCIIALENWKIKSGHLLKQWIDTLGEMEALSSLAILHFDHPDWVSPIIHDDQPRIFAVEMGHPLLPKDRVYNDLSMMRKGQVFLITGSNMSGKSTLLRTVGINLVLAYAGAPVCAKDFHCAIFDIYTSMRVRDDLEKNISSFYAELLRIKRMIEAAKVGEPVFFLLDEIFKGTNSRDRHTGARVLIKQLSEQGAIGFVSTHDVELGDLAAEDNKIRNYHFREFYKEGQLYFDYKLRQGISNTRNAIYLMKMAGVTVPDEK